MVEDTSRLGHIDATTGGIVGVVVLRNDVGRRCVANLKQLVVGVVGPRGYETVGISKSGFEVRAVKVVPGEGELAAEGCVADRAPCDVRNSVHYVVESISIVNFVLPRGSFKLIAPILTPVLCRARHRLHCHCHNVLYLEPISCHLVFSTLQTPAGIIPCIFP